MATRTYSTTPQQHTVAPSANSHYASMRCAEAAARSLSDQRAGHIALAQFTGVPWEGLSELTATRDSYYRLAGAYQAAGRRRERRETRAEAFAEFIDRPVHIAGWYARSYAREARRIAARIRRAVTV